MVVFLTWLLGSSLLFACFGLAAAQALGMRPRARLWVRLAGSCIAVAGLAVAVVQSVSTGLLPWGDAGVPWLVLTLLALIGTPLVCFRRGAAGPWGSDSGPDDPPDEPPSPWRPPGGGGIPLPAAAQSRSRVRDHTRARPGGRGPRRVTREPATTRPGVRPSR